MLLSYINDHMYFDLVEFVSVLCVSIPLWVLIFLVWQTWLSNGINVLNSESEVLEFFWTLVPVLVVLCLSFLNINYPSSAQVFSQSLCPVHCIKAIGHQWYWSYESGEGWSYESHMTDFICSVDKPLVLRYNVPCVLLVTSADVIHCFSVPDLGIKVDAVPGRINQIYLLPRRLGAFSGYCNELCGAGHSHMPIVVEVLLI